MHPLVRIIDSEEFRGHLYKAARHQIFKKVETGFVVCRSTKKGVLYTETIIGDSSSISFEDWGEKIIGFGKEDWEEIEYSNYCVEQSRHKIPKLIEIGKLHFHPRMLNGEEIRYIAPSTASNIEITENFEPEVRETGTGLSLIDQKPVRKVRKQVNTGNYGRGVETISLISTFGEGLTKETAKEDAINRATLYLYHDVIGYKNAESVVKEYNPEKMIPIGTKVRSYDFWPHDKTCYKEGVIVDHAPSPSCSPGCMHYHIRTTKVVRRGKSRPVEEGEIFMTHPYADPWDQEYPGQLAPHIQVISTAFPSTSTI